MFTKKKYWLFVLAWMTMIFYFSAQPAEQSNHLSQGVATFFIKMFAFIKTIAVEASATETWLNPFNNFIREFAHASVYFVLALLIYLAMNKSAVRGKKLFIFSFLICIAYALSDEIHQLFVPGRAFQLFDLFMDTTGTIVGLMITQLKKPSKVQKIV